jgi:TRAP-type C4-dicarboxylate transport system permease small subunit
MSSTSQNTELDSSVESPTEIPTPGLEQKTQFQVLRPLDAFIYQIEQNIVTFAALIMTSSVTLDIIFRALKGQSTQPAQSILSLFGLIPITQATPNPSWAIGPPLLFGGMMFGLGWAVYAARQRELTQELDQRKALQVGLATLVGSWILCMFILHLSSWIVCCLLFSLAGIWWIKRAYDQKNSLQIALRVGLSGYGIWLSQWTPQDYIWSQELSLILLAWMAFLGSSMATYQHKHIQISALSKLIPSSKKVYVTSLGLIITALFLCLH